jgi:hypothetical protein
MSIYENREANLGSGSFHKKINPFVEGKYQSENES